MVQISENTATGRGKVLLGTVLAQLGLGTAYAWAVFNNPLAEEFFQDTGKAAQISLTFSIMMVFLSFSTLTIGWLQAKLGVKVTLILDGIVMALGLFLTAVVAIPTKNLFLLYLFAGFMVGCANGTGYLLSLTNCLRFFPDRAGAVSGVAVGAYGIPAIIIPFIFNPMIKSSGLVPTVITWAIISLILIVGGGFFLKDAPIIGGKKEVVGEYTRGQMLRTPQAYLLWIGITAFCFAGLYIIGTSGSAATQAAKVQGVTIDATAYLIGTTFSIVALVGIVNTLGRFFFGWLSDRVKRTMIIALALTVMAVFAFVLGFSFLGGIPAPWLYILVYLLFGLSFGGCITVYPTIVGEYFGKNNQSKNYSIIYQGFAIGAFIGLIFNSMVAGGVPFGVTLIIGGVILAIGAVCLYVVKPPKPLTGAESAPADPAKA